MVKVNKFGTIIESTKENDLLIIKMSKYMFINNIDKFLIFNASYGVSTFVDGRKYLGYWKNDKMVGKGICFD